MSYPVEEVVAPAAIERAFGIYQQLQQRDQSVLLQARQYRPFADSVIWTKDLGGLPFGELPNAETCPNFMVGGGSMSLAWLAGGGCGLAPVGDRTELKSRKGSNGVTSRGDNNAAARTREG